MSIHLLITESSYSHFLNIQQYYYSEELSVITVAHFASADGVQ